MVASWACEVIEILTQRMKKTISCILCEDYGDHTNQASNHIPDLGITVSVTYDTLKKIFFTYASLYYCLILYSVR